MPTRRKRTKKLYGWAAYNRTHNRKSRAKTRVAPGCVGLLLWPIKLPFLLPWWLLKGVYTLGRAEVRAVSPELAALRTQLPPLAEMKARLKDITPGDRVSAVVDLTAALNEIDESYHDTLRALFKQGRLVVKPPESDDPLLYPLWLVLDHYFAPFDEAKLPEYPYLAPHLPRAWQDDGPWIIQGIAEAVLAHTNWRGAQSVGQFWYPERGVPVKKRYR